jgi:hypothetical protein
MGANMSINCVDDVRRVIGGAFESAFKDPSVGPRLAASHILVRLGLIDPDCVLVIDADHGEVRLGGVHETDGSAMLAMDTETANRWCLGRLDLAGALARGEVAMHGDLDSLFELTLDMDALPRVYADVLRREGREDLLVA